MGYHEMSREDGINYRRSGFLLAIIVAVLYAFLAIRGKQHSAILIVAIIMAISAWYETRPLRVIVTLLIRIGNFMHRFTNPVVFGLVYIVAVIPTAMALKLFGKDVLNLRLDSKRPTYWITRPESSTWKETFRNQY